MAKTATTWNEIDTGQKDQRMALPFRRCRDGRRIATSAITGALRCAGRQCCGTEAKAEQACTNCPCPL
jgi:hypothetical protein